MTETAKTFLHVIVVVVAAFMIITKNAVLMPIFVILLGIVTVPDAIKRINSKKDDNDNAEAYVSITIFGLIFVYFLFLLLSGHLYQ